MIQAGKTYTFTYANYGTPNGYPDYTAHSGKPVTVKRKLTPQENENSYAMWEVQADDGWRGHVTETELSE